MQAIADNHGDVGAMLKGVYSADKYQWAENEGIMRLLGRVLSPFPEDRPTAAEARALLREIMQQEAVKDVSYIVVPICMLC